MALLYIRDYFGNRAIELAGRVVNPSLQGMHIGTTMLEKFVEHENPDLLVTYTRNPAILKMISHVCGSLFPLEDNTELASISNLMPDAYAADDGVVYHLNRYGVDGLFKGFDPADGPFDDTGIALKKRFTHLQNPAHALIATGEIV